MKLFFSELEYLRELYGRLESEIAAGQQDAPELDAAELAEVVLKSRDLLRRIEQMNSRVLQLVEEWQTFKLSIKDDQRTEIQNLAQSVSTKGWELHASCARALTSLSGRVRKLQGELSEVGRGNRFLESVKPVHGNYPKFVDSLG